MRINHNIAALNTYRQLNSAAAGQSKSMEKLSSGLRINKAGDDAAGLAISEKMRAQVRGLDQASKNAQDGISLVQTAEGALNETHNILQRMRELAVQSANDTNNADDRTAIQSEINQLTSEINRVGNTTQFNTKNLLDGSVSIKDKRSDSLRGGAQLSAVTEIITTDTQASALSSTLNNSIELHGNQGASVTGGTGATTYTAAGAGPDIQAGNSELSFKVDGVTYTAKVAVKNYDGGAGNTAQNFIDDLNTAINATGAGANVTASLDANGKVQLKLDDAGGATGSTHSIEIAGGGMAETLYGASWETNAVKTAGKDSNLNFTFDIGAENDVSVTLTAGTYTLSNLASHLQTQINTATSADDVAVTVEGNKLKIENTTAGSTHQISDFQGEGAKSLGLTNATVTQAKDANNALTFQIDGETVNVTLSQGNYDKETLASVLQNAINSTSTVAKDVTVEVTSGDALKITSGEEGDAGSITVTDSAGAKALGLDSSQSAVVDTGFNGSSSELKMQIGANNAQTMSISISDMRSEALGISGTANTNQGSVTNAKFAAANNVTNGTNNSNVEASLDVSSVESATAAIEVLDNAINKVSEERSKLGSYTNRLEHTINNLGTSSENLTAAESRIRDVDMAKEMMNQTKNSILSQAAQAMLAQSNQMPQGVLQLLR